MKNILFLACALVSSFSYASHTVCSSPDLYFSSVRKDYGTPPPAGMEAGRLTIVKTGKILADQIFLIGEFTAPQYNVTLVGPKVVLKGLGNQTAGTSIFTDVAILKTADALSPELFRTPVVCETAWAFVP